VGDGNPLRRRVDKIEAVVLTLLVAIFLVACRPASSGLACSP
jgi:hypothetical protein